MSDTKDKVRRAKSDLAKAIMTGRDELVKEVTTFPSTDCQCFQTEKIARKSISSFIKWGNYLSVKGAKKRNLQSSNSTTPNDREIERSKHHIII